MFFRHQEGRYRETDRVTRYKLVKSGKHWLRASTSQFGLFKVLRGGIDTAQVTTEVVEDRVSTSLTGLDILKGIAAAGTLIGGGIATQSHVYANEQVAVEKVVDGTDTLVNSDQVVLGTVDKDGEQQASVSTSTSISESVSTSASTSESESVSTSTSTSVSASTSASVSASASESVSASTSTSVSASTSASVSASSTVRSYQATNVETAPTENQAETGRNNDQQTDAQKETVTPSLDGKVALANAISKVEDVNFKHGDVTTTATTAIAAAVDSGATAKKAEEERKKLAKLSAEMGEYLAKAVDLPDTDSAILKVQTAISEIEDALKDPNADLAGVVKTATSARNSIVNAVLRANSGQRDIRNGQAILTGVALRGTGIVSGSNSTASESVSTSISASESTLASHCEACESVKAKRSASTSLSSSASVSTSASASTSASESTLVSAYESLRAKSTSASASVSTSASESTLISACESLKAHRLQQAHH